MAEVTIDLPALRHISATRDKFGRRHRGNGRLRVEASDICKRLLASAQDVDQDARIDQDHRLP